MRYIAALILFWLTQPEYSPSCVFAHNDYAGPEPFEAAYRLGVGFIEADIFLKDGELFVAHNRSDITSDRTLDALYLAPLATRIRSNNGAAYPSGKLTTLTLMIDLKTDGARTLPLLVRKLESYPEIISCATVFITLSGSVPDPATWKNYPSYLWFDGRPAIAYTADQLERIRLISASFRDYSAWNGRGNLSDIDKQKLSRVVEKVHAVGKPLRFWATPDSEESWAALMELNLDVINTDRPTGLIQFIGKK